MHEYSVATEIAAIVKQTAQGRSVKKITIVIGTLSGVFSESLLMYLEIVLPDMGMDKVEIETKESAAVFACACGNEYTATNMALACPKCGGYERTIKAGQDCIVESIEVEDD
ncbi:MAG TPA: hydrogenase maturation nickel metallochaperone HypA [Chitinivibrionales bacterium]|nr:hydrogenase maturation nickel metallochaperone HypA [Chitinivibrionales bacterium]